MANVVGDEVLVLFYILPWHFAEGGGVFSLHKISPQGVVFVIISPYPFGETSFVLLLY